MVWRVVERSPMNEPNTPDRKVYFRLNCLAPARIVSRVEKFLVDGLTGNVQLNIRNGEILGCKCEDITAIQTPNRSRRTA